MTRKKFIMSAEEWCTFPELDVPAIKARIDTGATTSSIHAVNIKSFERNGQDYVSFDVFPLDNKNICVHCVAPQKDIASLLIKYFVGFLIMLKVEKKLYKVTV